jgi:hypothetical protein
MTKKWIAINLILLAAVSVLGWQLYQSVKRFKAQNSIASLTRPQAVKNAAETTMPPAEPVRKFSDAEYAVIPTNDLFVEARKKDAVVEAPAPVEVARKLNNPPTLVGIAIAGTQRRAMIVDPTGSGPAGARKTQTLKIGDDYQGFAVTAITDNGMVLEAGASREVIPLFAPGKVPQQGKTPILPTQTVNFGPAQQGGPQRPGGASGAQGRTAVASQAPVSIGGQRGNQPPVVVGGPQQRATSATQPQGQMPQNQFIDSAGRQVVRTPFGDLPITAPPAQTPVKK